MQRAPVTYTVQFQNGGFSQFQNGGFSTFYNQVNKFVNKHAPLKMISKLVAKTFTKPWISKGLRVSIKIKNALFYSNHLKYKIYRNSIVTLTRASKRLYYHTYFSSNLSNMKKTWDGIRDLIGGAKNVKRKLMRWRNVPTAN